MTDGKAVEPGVFALTTNMTIGWTKKIHNGMGNVAMADGSVQQTGNRPDGGLRSDRLQQMMRDQKMMTNWLAVP
jgi:prepilin-type processing-associated H-X9-DG protein